MHGINAAYCYRCNSVICLSVCLSVCLLELGYIDEPAKTDKPIEMLIGVYTGVASPWTKGTT